MLNFEYRKVETLIPYARNPRTHSDEQVAKIAASIVEYGWTSPVLVDGANGIIAGHGRLAAARKLGLAEVPVIELAHLSPAQKRAYIIADNRLALDAGWNDELLALQLAELSEAGYDLALTGFEASEIEALASFGEIEREARRQRRELMGETLGIMINGRDTGNQVEEPRCEKCKKPMEFEGYRRWEVHGSWREIR